MAVKLIANYAKRLGLPGYSSHQFSVSIETELQNLDNVAQDSAQLYESLQGVVDQQIQKTGFVPPNGYGMNGDQAPPHHHRNDGAGISSRQLDLIHRIIKENNANKSEIDQLSLELFGGGIRTLNRMQASNFIDALFERYPRRNGQRQSQPARSS
jgi:hypothetical protein